MSVQITQFKRRQAAARAEVFPNCTIASLQNQLLAVSGNAYIAPAIQGSGITPPTDPDWITVVRSLFSFNLIPLNALDTSLRIEVSVDGIVYDTWRTYALYPGGANQIVGVWLPYFSVRLRLFNGSSVSTQLVSGTVKAEAGH
jgi:hypothetical protein